MIHNLKISMEYYAHIKEGKKRFEVRYNDRDYQVGDVLRLQEINTKTGYDKLGSSCYIIIYVHTGLGMQEGYVVLGIEPSKERG